MSNSLEALHHFDKSVKFKTSLEMLVMENVFSMWCHVSLQRTDVKNFTRANCPLLEHPYVWWKLTTLHVIVCFQDCVSERTCVFKHNMYNPEKKSNKGEKQRVRLSQTPQRLSCHSYRAGSHIKDFYIQHWHLVVAYDITIRPKLLRMIKTTRWRETTNICPKVV